MNDIKLSPLELKQIKNDIKQLTHQIELPISYFNDSGWNPGHSDVGSGWSSYDNYWCGKEKISKVNIKRFPYGDLKTGDLILYINSSTTLPDSDKYKIKYNDIEYTTNEGLIPQSTINENILYYMLVGKR
jgi:hypothetical protein